METNYLAYFFWRLIGQLDVGKKNTNLIERPHTCMHAKKITTKISKRQDTPCNLRNKQAIVNKLRTPGHHLFLHHPWPQPCTTQAHPTKPTLPNQPPPQPITHLPANMVTRPPPGPTCVHCGATETPLWRAGPAGPKTLCNACGVRWRKHGTVIPRARRTAGSGGGGGRGGEGGAKGGGGGGTGGVAKVGVSKKPTGGAAGGGVSKKAKATRENAGVSRRERELQRENEREAPVRFATPTPVPASGRMQYDSIFSGLMVVPRRGVGAGGIGRPVPMPSPSPPPVSAAQAVYVEERHAPSPSPSPPPFPVYREAGKGLGLLLEAAAAEE